MIWWNVREILDCSKSGLCYRSGVKRFMLETRRVNKGGRSRDLHQGHLSSTKCSYLVCKYVI